ncbi:fibronectin type III domain protein, partial [Ostertagia ostertagi]
VNPITTYLFVCLCFTWLTFLEPCTVPQSLRLEAISCETATVSWRPPKVNNGAESYVIQFTQEPAPQFAYWNRYKVGQSTKFTLTDLLPDTRYILCVSAEHNYGLAAMSKSIRFRTKRWWADDDSTCLQLPNANRRLSMASVISSLSALR